MTRHRRRACAPVDHPVTHPTATRVAIRTSCMTAGTAEVWETTVRANALDLPLTSAVVAADPRSHP